jgi:hypothetical protein
MNNFVQHINIDIMPLDITYHINGYNMSLAFEFPLPAKIFLSTFLILFGI